MARLDPLLQLLLDEANQSRETFSHVGRLGVC
jgi:hypothetical protein